MQLREFSCAKRHSTVDASTLITNALVSSCLDYCNFPFRSLSRFSLHKLQCVQNSAARIVSKTTRFSSIMPVLKKLHWLPIEQQTIFKTATLVYKYLNTGFPKCFSLYLSLYKSTYTRQIKMMGLC